MALVIGGHLSAAALGSAALLLVAGAAAADTASTVRDVGAIVAEQYVYEDLAVAGRDGIDARLANGAYDRLEGEALADKLSEDLRAFTQDNHIRVVFDPDRVQHYRDREAAEQSPEAQARIEEAHREDVAESVANNFGIRGVEILPGNVGYIRIDYFDPNLEDGGAARIAAVMDMVAGTDALIFDLRRCVGGQLDTVGHWLSYLYGDEPVQYGTEIERWRNHEAPVFTDPAVVGVHQPDAPVYALTSGMTFSGGEHFPYHLQGLGRLTAIVGERTYGGGVGWDPVVVNDDFYIRIPRELLINARTGTLYGEGEGLAPNVAVPAADALNRALVEALTGLMASDDQESAARRAWALRIATARANHFEGDPARLSVLASEFGPYAFSAEDGTLMLSFNGRPPYALEQLSNAAFYDDRSIQRQFLFNLEDGEVTSLRIETADGDWDELPAD